MILEYIRPGQYKITNDGHEIATLCKRYYHRITKQRLSKKQLISGEIQPRDIWSNGYVLTLNDGKEEIFHNIANVGEKHTFANYPGPRNVLRPNKKHRYLNN